ncbi:MAG: hypothetical protein LBC46_00925 [Treponema sp.]|jgi:hypothetical protein|nr:hypothetical protein [Treponema sp.]
MYKSYIALEVRIRFPSETKAFCACAVNNNAAVSCPVCRGESGAVPLLNTLAARKAYLLIQGLHGSIIREAVYERNVSVLALLDGHALSRLSVKLGVDAGIDIMFHRRKKHIRITEIRLEEDAGRLIRHTAEVSHAVPETHAVSETHTVPDAGRLIRYAAEVSHGVPDTHTVPHAGRLIRCAAKASHVMPETETVVPETHATEAPHAMPETVVSDAVMHATEAPHAMPETTMVPDAGRTIRHTTEAP